MQRDANRVSVQSSMMDPKDVCHLISSISYKSKPGMFQCSMPCSCTPQLLSMVPANTVAHMCASNPPKHQVLGGFLRYVVCFAAILAMQGNVSQPHVVSASVIPSCLYSLSIFRDLKSSLVNAGQSVYHLHVHVFGGKQLGWPPC